MNVATTYSLPPWSCLTKKQLQPHPLVLPTAFRLQDSCPAGLRPHAARADAAGTQENLTPDITLDGIQAEIAIRRQILLRRA